MKTYYAHLKSLRAWSILGLLGVMTASCGSYQNTSYYDKDGVYGSAGSDVRKKETASTTGNNQGYKDYFDSKQESSEVFTDVDNYTSATDSTDTSYAYASDTAGWGSGSENVVVNVYDNSWGWNYWNTPAWGWYGPGWNWSIGWGWNSWYGPSWGYYSGWGWGGYPYYGGYYGGYYGNYYGNHHHGNYAYGLGRRGSGYNYGVNGGRRNNSYAAVGGRSGSRNYGRSEVNNGGRRSVTSYSTRNSGTRNTNYSTSNSSSTRSNSTYTPSRSSSSSSSSSGSSRSYNSGSSGGSRSSGGSYGGSSGGGGRSSGGGGGRRG